ncbi:glutamate receptor ionotropic, delta-1-like [Scylla paramamosain]|uniref:glutamate receptor ionotropic, delta-1-like n=1 Tax=Scylla paramamosain TaxID=85552 RepID=UPI00308344F8
MFFQTAQSEEKRSHWRIKSLRERRDIGMKSSKPFLRVAVEQWETWITLLPQEDGSMRIKGPMSKFMDVVAKVLNFDYELVRPKEWEWGGPDANGSWTGMLGMLQREEVEMALGPFTITPQRETISDMSMPLSSENKAIMVERPRVRTDMAGFLKAFTIEVWLLTMLSIVGISCATMLVVWAQGRIFGRSVRDTVSQTLMWVLKALTQEGSEWLPPHDAGRVLVTTWLLASLVFMSSYGGILTAMLTVPRVTIPIDSMYDLVAQNDMPWKVEGGSMLYQYFQEATGGARREVFLRSSGTFKDCWEARQDLADGKYAGFCDDVTMIKVMAWDFETSGRCNVYIAREKVISSVWKGVGFRRNSSYMSRVNDVILTLQQAGLVDIWLKEQIGTVPQCLRPPSADRQDGISALDLEAFGGPFLVLVAGFSVATSAFLLELLTACFSRS